MSAGRSALPPAWREGEGEGEGGGEVAVVGLARSGQAACELLRRFGARVYASDIGETDELARAAERLRALGCDVQLGGHDAARIARAAALVVSPGVPPDAAPYRAAAEAKVEILAELDLGARFLTATRLIVVTGTNGKTTTTALTAHLLAATGLGPGEGAGNIGRPLCSVALGEAPAWLAVEASSFQLHDCPTLAPAVGVLTNLAPDHLDRYPSADAYYADKQLLFRNAGEADRWVTNADDARVAEMAHAAPGVHEHFSLTTRGAAGYFDRTSGWLNLRGMPLVRREDVRLIGDHNVENALAAALAVPREADRDRIADGLRSFRPLPHRLEPVREVGGVTWINDSKATNLASTLVAVSGMDRPFVLLLGGRHKGEPYTGLAPHLARARAVVAFGEAAPLIEQDLAGAARVERGGDFPDVLALARRLARPGDAVLLSPACSSYDMFDNYEDRGRQFRAAVEAMT